MVVVPVPGSAKINVRSRLAFLRIKDSSLVCTGTCLRVVGESEFGAALPVRSGSAHAKPLSIMTLEKRLKDFGIELPAGSAPAARRGELPKGKLGGEFNAEEVIASHGRQLLISWQS